MNHADLTTAEAEAQRKKQTSDQRNRLAWMDSGRLDCLTAAGCWEMVGYALLQNQPLPLSASDRLLDWSVLSVSKVQQGRSHA